MPTMRSLALPLLAAAASAEVPVIPEEYSTVMMARMPYFGLEMPLRVLTSKAAQKVWYYDGLEVDVSSANGTHKLAFQNGKRGCMFKPATAGPTVEQNLQGSGASKSAAVATWQPQGFLPADLSKYTQVKDELVGGILCQKFVLNEKHGSKGTMDDHISFYWDPVLGKPVRWHMHSRHKTFGSHTDEYIMDFVSFQSGAPVTAELGLPAECAKPTKADISMQLGSLLAAAKAVRSGSSGSESTPLLFEAFLKQHGKSYAAEEHKRRQQTFEKNVQLIAELNQRHAGAARFRGNAFLDMTKEEVLRFRGGKQRSLPRAQRRSPEHRPFVREHIVTASGEAKARPQDFDWRTARPGVIGPVKDQAFCGSCWAFGLTGPVEAIHAIQSGRRVELPEQFVVDCTWTNGTGSSGGNFGCDGGDSDIGALEIVKKFGGAVPTAKSYGSYLSVNGFCKDPRHLEMGAKITGWVDVKARNESAVLDALVTKGPLSLGIMVPEEMLYYDSGVLKVESCRHKEDEIDHAVELTGYGTDEHGTDYYTIRNSWSTYWGDEGYIRVARGELDCAVSSEAGYPEVQVPAAQAQPELLV